MDSKVLSEIIAKCLDEMYRKSQPSITWEELNKNHEEGKYSEKDRGVDQHYLSMEEYKDIVDSYLYDYNLINTWKDDAQLMIDYLEKGGTKDKYIPKRTDEKGNYHPGYRGYDNTPKLIDALKEFLSEENAQKACDKVFELMNTCKDFYRGDRIESSFRFNVMNYSPNSCLEKVQEYWKDKGVVIYPTEFDAELGEYVKVTEETLNNWERDLEWAEENKEVYLIESLTELLQKYGRIKDNSNS